MNETDHEDNDLAKAFRELKAVDLESAPAFSLPSSRSGSWRLGFTAYALAAACVAMVFSIGLSHDPSASPETITFDRYSKIISREIYASTATAWRSPTSFLINTHLPTLTEFDL